MRRSTVSRRPLAQQSGRQRGKGRRWILAKALEGGKSKYLAYVGRTPAGDLSYVGITADFDQLVARHGGPNSLEVIGSDDPLPLIQARALAQAVLSGAGDHSAGRDLVNGRSIIQTASSNYGPAIIWGNHQLDAVEFEW